MPEDVPNAVMRSVRIDARSDTLIRQLAGETERTRSDIVAEILGDGCEATAGRAPALPGFGSGDAVMRSVVIPGALDERLRTLAIRAGVPVATLIRETVEHGIQARMAPA